MFLNAVYKEKEKSVTNESLISKINHELCVCDYQTLQSIFDFLNMSNLNSYSKLIKDYNSKSQILYCKSEGNYTVIHFLDNTKIVVTKTLKAVQKALPASCFLRIHRSYIINIFFIRDRNLKKESKVSFDDGTLLPISRRYKAKLSKIGSDYDSNNQIDEINIQNLK